MPIYYDRKHKNEYCLCGCGRKLTGIQTKYASRECSNNSRTYKGHAYLKQQAKLVDSTCPKCGHKHKAAGSREYCRIHEYLRTISDYGGEFNLGY